MNIRIAIIEDNPDNLHLMRYLLTQFGYEIVCASDGEQGLALVRQECPALIICDIQLPHIDGYQIARIVKSDPSLCHIPLVAVTAYAMVGDRAKILASGYDEYVSKPIDPENFVKEIERFLVIKPPKK